MRKFASLLTFVFLAVFAAGTAMHTVSATVMALDMATSADGAMSIPDCQGCPEGGDSDATASCDVICTAPVFAMVKGMAAAKFAIAIAMREWPLGMTLPRGLQAPPDPFPPRTLV